MEWVETTGRTVEEATRSALEQLGVDSSDAEVEILSEPKIGLFGRLKEEARVRARVKPRYPRSKGERRDRRRGHAGEARPGEAAEPRPARTAGTGTEVPAATTAREARPQGGAETGTATAVKPNRRRRRTGPSGEAGGGGSETSDGEGTNFSQVSTVTGEEQARLAEEFLRGLLQEMGAEAKITSSQGDGTVEVLITGEDLGALIGPKGATLLALQEITRTVLQRQAAQGDNRVVVDINGYRKKRQEALARFARQVAAEVVTSNQRRALEPMLSADRKVVHDAVTGIEGVVSVSEGEEPYRRVVLVPSSATEPTA
jgi:spoIIIJ-associated protein